jgi:outer membrane protein assembly factor BamB
MQRKFSFLLALSVPLIFSIKPYEEISPDRQWPQYRGYYSSGVLDNANLPEEWDIIGGKNIRWKIEIPGLGLSSPVIWGDNLFITTAISEKDSKGLKTGIYGDIGSVNDDSEHEWKVICLDKHSGDVIWEQTSFRGIPEQKRHLKSTHANSSVATDGKYIVAFFGSEGLYCYDMQGNLIWDKDFGVLRSVFFRVESAEWEFASSPIIHQNTVVVQCDVMENSFIAAYDVSNGKELWKQLRDEYPGWCTPNIYSNNGRTLIAVNGYKHRGAYDFHSGEEIWKMSGGGDIQIPTPVIGDDLVYFNSAHGPSSPVLAVKKTAKGKITMEPGEYVSWVIPRGGAYMQTMLLYNGLLYNLKWNGAIQCFNALSGEEIYSEKLGRSNSFTASPVVADERIYAASDDGMVYIIQTGQDFKVLSEYSLDDICMVTPAITENIIFFRTQRHLIAIGKDP